MVPATQRNEFVDRYGGIYEHSPWVAEECFSVAAGNEDVDELAGIFAACVDKADHERKLALIRAHPDLAGNAAIGGELTDITFDVLYAEGEESPKMMSVGLHCRLAGRPGRAMAVQKFLDYVKDHSDVWVTRRIDIARHWQEQHPAMV